MAFLIAVVMNVGTYWFSDKIVLGMYSAREVTRADAPELFGSCRTSPTGGASDAARLHDPIAQPNAFATGRDPHHAAVAVTDGIMRMLSPDELRGVLGHELAHVRQRNLHRDHGRDLRRRYQHARQHGAVGDDLWRGAVERSGGWRRPIGGLVMILVAPIAAMLIQMAISRSREFQADEGGARIAGNPLSLANALRKLQLKAEQIPMDANPATAHMFIVSPRSGKGLASLFSTHPPMEERIARLEAMVYGSAALQQ